MNAPIFTSPVMLQGPWREPVQMLADQSYGDHGSIHDPEIARSLGFENATIEGPTHFSQFDPLASAIWGRRWFESGCISVHFRNAAFAGDRLRASLEIDGPGAETALVRLEREDGSEILRGSASVGPSHARTALETRLAGLSPLENRQILAGVSLGERSVRRPVTMEYDSKLGKLYPFTLREKLVSITEPSPLYEDASTDGAGWGRPIIPLEMISVLMKYTDENAPFAVPEQAVNLFADMEVRLLKGPLFVEQAYEIDHEVVFFSGSRRTESMWVRTRVYEPGAAQPLAEMLLNTATMKDSVPA